MFQFSTTTLVNSLTDFTTGQPLFTVVNKGTQQAPDNVVYVKRQGIYRIDDDHKICAYKAVGHKAYLDVLDLSGIASTADNQTKNYRVALYIRSTGNADPLFANSYVFKGRPFYVEFAGGSDAKKNFANALNKYQNVTVDTPVLKLAKTLDGNFATESVTVGITAAPKADNSDVAYAVAANQYMRIYEAKLQEFVPASDGKQDYYKDILDLKTSYVATGKEGFGDFEHLEKDYRLPTAANLRWKRTLEDEMPVPGVLYNQYTIYYLVNRGNMGGAAVGQQVKSETTHVFWVQQGLASNFEAEMTKLTGVTFEVVPEA